MDIVSLDLSSHASAEHKYYKDLRLYIVCTEADKHENNFMSPTLE